MGGKGGGGDSGGAGDWVYVDTSEGPVAMTPQYAASTYPGQRTMTASEFTANGNKFSDPPAPEPAAAPAPAAAAAPEPAPAPAPAAVLAPEPTPAAPAPPPTSAGGAIPGPTAAGNPPITSLGNGLGDAVLSPPKYWVGGIDSTRNTKKGSGSLKTTTT